MLSLSGKYQREKNHKYNAFITKFINGEWCSYTDRTQGVAFLKYWEEDPSRTLEVLTSRKVRPFIKNLAKHFLEHGVPDD